MRKNKIWKIIFIIFPVALINFPTCNPSDPFWPNWISSWHTEFLFIDFLFNINCSNFYQIFAITRIHGKKSQSWRQFESNVIFLLCLTHPKDDSKVSLETIKKNINLETEIKWTKKFRRICSACRGRIK